jgi:hypothetical protein
MNSNNMERLAKLNDLRSSGALTEAEFETEKRALLARRTTRWPIYVGIAAIVLLAFAIATIWFSKSTTPATIPARVPAVQSSLLPSTSLPSISLSPADRLAQAMLAATGHRRPFAQSVKGDVFTVKPLKIVELPFGPALLVTRDIKDGCHACSGFLGIYYLREDNGQTIATGSYPEAVSGWGWGAAPTDWHITQRFTANPAIFASGGYMGQGIVESSATITELTPEGPVTSDLIGTGYSDSGAITDDNPRPGCELKSNIANVVKDRSFDVVISGTLRAKDRYVKRGGKFVALNKRDWGLPCPQPPTLPQPS